MPSLYEPCGLNQMYSLNYGTIPVVRRTGGLADTVVDLDEDPANGNGFVFDRAETTELERALRRAISRYDDRFLWLLLQKRGMASDFSWTTSAASYLSLYREAVVASEMQIKKTPTD